MFLSDYLRNDFQLDLKGVFDPIIDSDSPFFINLQRLKQTQVPEFVGSYKKIHERFRQIIKLLDRAEAKDEGDIFFSQALRLFKFSEVNNLCLGYAVGTKGSGFGVKLSRQVMYTAFDIVKAGVEDPEFFELLPLFQENVGADRLSDMIATLILDDIERYTLRINKELNILKSNFPGYTFDAQGFLVNPYRRNRLLLVPLDILHTLPVAESWEDIDSVVSLNIALRNEINLDIEEVWTTYTKQERKEYLCEEVFKNPESCKRVIKEYRTAQVSLFNPRQEISYLLEKINQFFIHEKYNWGISNTNISSYDVAMKILERIKDWIENNKGWEVIQIVDSRYREKVVQRVIHAVAINFREAYNVDISCEPNEGPGAVDFKISRGTDNTVIEIKLSSNNKYLHGFTDQVVEYAKAEQTTKMIYVLLDLGHPYKIGKLKEKRDEMYDQGKLVPTLFIIDSSTKDSASK